MHIQSEKLVTQLSKICRYWEICQNLTKFARDFPILARNLQVEALRSYEPIQSGICNPSHPNCWVHAEIQIIFHYAMHKPARSHGPRVLGTSKAACYLCNLFIMHHGEYFVSKTHGQLYDQWTIPDLASVSAVAQDSFRAVLGDINQDILRDTELNRQRKMKRANPADSWTSLDGRSPQRPAPDSSTVLSELPIQPADPAHSSSLDLQSNLHSRHYIKDDQGTAEALNAEVLTKSLQDIEEGPSFVLLEEEKPHETRSTTMQAQEQLLASSNGTSSPPTPTMSPKEFFEEATSGLSEDLTTPPVALISAQNSTSELSMAQASYVDLSSTTIETLDLVSLTGLSSNPILLQRSIKSSSPLHIKFENLLLELECEDQIRGNLRILPPPPRVREGEPTTPIDCIEIATWKANEDIVLKRKDDSQELMVEFYSQNRYVLGISLRWLR